eukprot:TRINITY_DN2551_c0_g5_i1.p1 TRINITY_DN2551_c0_g5~~TRINITY_DN2551_c0_g5_i1.p1  ORF type:complete len:452 (+),score=133.09 TRINITY_DN2551_c0_g5_i1:192-1358(+)
MATLGVVVMELIPAHDVLAPKAMLITNVYPDPLHTNTGRLRVNWTQVAEASRKGLLDDVAANLSVNETVLQAHNKTGGAEEEGGSVGSALSLPPGVLVVSSFTPGSIRREMDVVLSAGFTCGSSNLPDLASSFHVRHGCLLPVGIGAEFNLSLAHNLIPSMEVLSDGGEGALGALGWRQQVVWWKGWGGAVREKELGVPRIGEGGDAVADFWTGWREEGLEEERGMEQGQPRMTKVGFNSGDIRRWQFGIDAIRIEAFSLHGIPLDYEPGSTALKEYLVMKNVTAGGGSEGWHWLHFRMRSSSRNVPNKFVLTLFWKSLGGRGQQQQQQQQHRDRPLLRMRADFQEHRLQQANEEAAIVGKVLPDYCSVFSKSSLPQTYAFVDFLYLP